MAKLTLEIITPEDTIFEGKIESIKVPGSKGSFMILKNHAPIVSTLETGDIEITSPDIGVKTIPVKSGVIEVQQNKITVLVESK